MKYFKTKERINFLDSLPKTGTPWKTTVKVLSFGLILANLPYATTSIKNRPSKKQVLYTVSQTIPPFVAAPQPSRVTQFESDLKTRITSETALVASKIEVDGSGVRITLPSDNLFQTGSAAFDGKLEPQLRSFVQWLSARNDGFRVVIESHTDDTPIVKHRKTFKTNWDLSAARAVAVAGVFQDSKFPESRMEAVGYADSRPLGNDRNQNRRIVLRFTDASRSGT